MQVKPWLRHLDRVPIDRAVRDADHHVRTIARAMVDRFLATATYVALAKRIDLPAAFEPKMVFELSVGNRPA